MRKLFLIAGTVSCFLAVFAEQVGIDNDAGWGKGRIILLVLGLMFFLVTILDIRYPEKLAGIKNQLSIHRYSLAATTITVIIYIWLAQVNIKNTQKDYRYYSELALSFKKGQLYLTEEPSSALLGLSNPYDYDLRVESNVEDFPWDVSLYKDKFYIYWGPAPSLILTIFGTEQLAKIEDRFLVLGFALGLFLYEAFIISGFRQNSVQSLPGWLNGVSMLAVSLSVPATIMLKDSRVYEAAIFGAQFFFIGGCYWAYSSIRADKPVSWKLLLAGIHWTLALGTRITILPVVIFSAGVTALHIMKACRVTNPRLCLIGIMALGMPLTLGLTGLGWYNWARFDSVFEFGIKYQLTNINYNVFRDSFSSIYITGNVYNYFLHPLKILSSFPYLTRIEYVVSNERLGGLIFTAPYMFLVFTPFMSTINSLLLNRKETSTTGRQSITESWLISVFTGAAFIAMAMIMSFWFVTMRYMEDFMPSLLLLSTIHLGRTYRTFEENERPRKILVFIAAWLATVTVFTSVLVALPVNGMDFWVNVANTIRNIFRFNK